MPGELDHESDSQMGVGHYDRLCDSGGDWMHDINRPYDDSETKQKERILNKMKSRLYKRKDSQ